MEKMQKLFVLGYYEEGDVLDQGGFERCFVPILVLDDEEEAKEMKEMMRRHKQAKVEFWAKAPSRCRPHGTEKGDAYRPFSAKDGLYYRDASEAEMAGLWYDFELTPEYDSLFEASHCETYFRVNAR